MVSIWINMSGKKTQSLERELRVTPVTAVLVVLDLVVRLEAEPVRDRAVPARGLGERNLGAERLLRRLVSTHAPSLLLSRVGEEGCEHAEKRIQ